MEKEDVLYTKPGEHDDASKSFRMVALLAVGLLLILITSFVIVEFFIWLTKGINGDLAIVLNAILLLLTWNILIFPNF